MARIILFLRFAGLTKILGGIGFWSAFMVEAKRIWFTLVDHGLINPLQFNHEPPGTSSLHFDSWFWSNYSDLTRPHPKWWFSKGNPLISGKSRLVKYYNLARWFKFVSGSIFWSRGILRLKDDMWQSNSVERLKLKIHRYPN